MQSCLSVEKSITLFTRGYGQMRASFRFRATLKIRESPSVKRPRHDHVSYMSSRHLSSRHLSSGQDVLKVLLKRETFRIICGNFRCTRECYASSTSPEIRSALVALILGLLFRYARAKFSRVLVTSRVQVILWRM